MPIPYADLHCDTAFEMYRTKQAFDLNNLAVSLNKATAYSPYMQVMAFWSDANKSSNAAYAYTKKALRYWHKQISSVSAIDFTPILAIEDARILDERLKRLKSLHRRGIRILTLLWKGESCIGGAYDTHIGLSRFGKEVVKLCWRLGILTDISHASFLSTDDIFLLANKQTPIIASHSDFYSVTPHPRNLTDEHFKEIMRHNGIVGVCLCAKHLGTDATKSNGICCLLRHIEHGLSLGGEDHLAFGCDFDGTETPADLSDISCMERIADAMLSLNYSENIVRKIYFENAKRILQYIM